MKVRGDGSPAQYWIVDYGSANSVSLCEVTTDSTGDMFLVLSRSKNMSVGRSGS